MKYCFFAVALLVMALSGYTIGRAQTSKQQTIELGGTTLRLGMPKDSAIAALAQNYEVPENGMVITKTGPPYDTIGQVVFANGRLSKVLKYWTTNNEEAGFELANNLYGVMDGLKVDGNTICNLDTDQSQSPTGEFKDVNFICGDRRVEISAIRFRHAGQSQEAGTITEFFGR